MLSQHTIDIIKSTIPIFEQQGAAIAKTFYSNIIQKHPGLLNYFNRTNLERGRQQTALANTLLAAAKNIDKLQAIMPAVMQIAHKHRGLGVLPEHYPMVGESILEAIKEVLGDAASDDIMKAWAEAYGIIADVFISIEEDLYKEAEKEGGWRLFKPLKVAKKVRESENVTSFHLVTKDGTKLPKFKAGQYITVRVKVPGDEFTSNRHYTLSQPANNGGFCISVKREEAIDSKGIISNYLHDSLNEGDSINVSAPAGLFTLQQNSNPVLFVSGGIGVTPLYSMLQTMELGRQVAFIQSVRNENSAPFKEQITKKIDELNGTYRVLLSDETGYIAKEDLASVLEENMEIYVCGPAPFMETVIKIAHDLGVPDNNIHFEFFGPAIFLEGSKRGS